MAKRARFRINPDTGKFEDVSTPEAEPAAALPIEASTAVETRVADPVGSKPPDDDYVQHGISKYAPQWMKHRATSVFNDSLSDVMPVRGTPAYIEDCRKTVLAAKTLKEFYDLFCDAYLCAESGNLQHWFTSIFAEDNKRPKIYASQMAHGSKVPLPFWGGPATVDLGETHGQLSCYSIATPKGYFGAVSWDEEHVMMLTTYPDARERDVRDCIPSEYRTTHGKAQDYVCVIPWRYLEDMDIGEATESMITYCWAGSELRYALAKDYRDRPRTLEERGRETMEWAPRKWEVIPTERQQKFGRGMSEDSYYGKFEFERTAQLLAEAVGGTVDPQIWWLVCKEHKCGHKTEPFWVGVPECPDCGSVMLHTSGFESWYKEKK